MESGSSGLKLENFKKEKCIGKGGFGIAYLCRDANNKKCVIKEIYAGHLTDEEVVTSCKEAGILSSLKHPNVIEYMDHGIVDRTIFIVMEYAPGGDLNEHIAKIQPNPAEKMVLGLLAQLVAGLYYVHEKGIVHRDICAKNVLIGRGGILKLSDFGMSKRMESMSSGGIAGNPVNFAPELCWGGKATTASDVWALGCLLHHIATGQSPFQAPSLAGLVRCIISSAPPKLPGCYSPQMTELLKELLAKEPKARPSVSHLLAHPLLAIPVIEAGLPTPVGVKQLQYFGLCPVTEIPCPVRAMMFEYGGRTTTDSATTLRAFQTYANIVSARRLGGFE